jgi:uncharacterized protein (TIGR04255 family)
MTLEGKVRPVNTNHSIKEAVIGLFLASPIVKPDRFKVLRDEELANFQSYEPIAQYQVQVVSQAPGRNPDVSNRIYNDAGFKFTEFENGQPSKVLQGLNDVGNSRNYISYHSLNYTRWAPFFKEYHKIISSVSRLDSGMFITAISLHYIDQFIWTDAGPIDLKLLFNDQAAFIPREFFNAIVNNYTIVTEKQMDKTRKYLDRLEITIDNEIQRSIAISHNVTQPLSELISLENLLKGADLTAILNAAHNHNKSILNDLLTKEATHIINLVI